MRGKDRHAGQDRRAGQRVRPDYRRDNSGKAGADQVDPVGAQRVHPPAEYLARPRRVVDRVAEQPVAGVLDSARLLPGQESSVRCKKLSYYRIK